MKQSKEITQQIMILALEIMDRTDKPKTDKGIRVNQCSRIMITLSKDLMKLLEDD